MLPLLNRDIRLRQLDLCSRAKKVDIASYNLHLPYCFEFLKGPNVRLITGAPETYGERQATISSTIRAVACAMPKVQVRLLLGSHIKLMIASTPRGLSAIVGSQNLGLGHPFELAVELTNKEAEPFAAIFTRLWKQASPIKSLNLAEVKASLESGVFGVPSRR